MASQSARRRDRGFTLLEMVIVCAILVVLAATLFTIFFRPRPEELRSRCIGHLRQLAMAFANYTQDADGKFPPLQVQGGWVSAVKPYVKDGDSFRCPVAKETQPNGLTDFSFNAFMSGKDCHAVGEDNYRTVLLVEGNSTNNPRQALRAIPSRWSGDEQSPLYRHIGGFNVLCVDGHVDKWSGRFAREPNFNEDVQFRPENTARQGNRPK